MQIPRTVLAAGLLALAMVPAAGSAQEPPAPQAKVQPAALPVRPVNAVYFEADPVPAFQKSLLSLAVGLRELKLIDGVPTGKDAEISPRTRELWQELARLNPNSRIRFLSDGFYTARWIHRDTAKRAHEIAQRIHTRGDVGLIIVFGTEATLAAKAIKTSVPVVALSVTDPVGSGLTTSEHFSGQDNFFVRTSGQRMRLQLELFHRLFPFKKLGLIVDPTLTDLNHPSIQGIQQVASKEHFSIQACRAAILSSDSAIAGKSLLACAKELADKGIDAFYLNRHTVEPKELRRALDLLTDRGIPTVSTNGRWDVRNGALISIMPTRFEEAGDFEARAIDAILKGATPGRISQQYATFPTVSLNLRTATNLNWAPPLELLASVDHTYQ